MSHDTYRLGLPLRTPEDDDPQVADLLQGHKKAIGMVPNMYAAMANLPAQLETYSFGYERFRKTSGFTPAEQEIVFLTISRAVWLLIAIALLLGVAALIKYLRSGQS